MLFLYHGRNRLNCLEDYYLAFLNNFETSLNLCRNQMSRLWLYFYDQTTNQYYIAQGRL
jgi:hypothetical protein